MTFLGKLLTLLQVSISFFFLAIALVVWNPQTRMHYADYTIVEVEGESEKEVKMPGRITQTKQRIKEVLWERPAAEKRWDTVYPQLLAAEAEQPVRAAWFNETLLIMDTGKDKAGKVVNPPIQVLKYDPATGRIIIDPDRKGESVMVGDKKALALIEYERQYNELIEQIAMGQKKLKELVEEEKRLTAALNGSKEVPKGLRERLVEQQEFAENSRREQEYLQPILGNRWAEAQLLLKRSAQLQERRDELKRHGAVLAGR